MFNAKESSKYYTIDLSQAAEAQLQFLQAVDKNEELKKPSCIRHAIYRYEKYWLPLVAENKSCLPAPLDIEWVWHCHMLSPTVYEQDCMAICGVLVDHKLHTTKDRDNLLKQSQKLWNKQYPNVPFIAENVSDEPLKYDSKITYDILSSSERQAVFFYQVSLPHFHDKTFLKDAELRYRKFLFLKQQNPKEFLVPCYDIDLVWHAHQLHPSKYKTDTERVLGKMLKHDDTVNDRSPDSKLNRSDARTRELWQGTFNETFSKYGAMFRGNPPQNLYIMTKMDTYVIATKTSDVAIHDVTITNPTGRESEQRKDINVKFKIVGVNNRFKERHQLLKITGKFSSMQWNGRNEKALRPFSVRSDFLCSHEVILSERTGCAGLICRTRQHFGKYDGQDNFPAHRGSSESSRRQLRCSEAI